MGDPRCWTMQLQLAIALQPPWEYHLEQSALLLRKHHVQHLHYSLLHVVKSPLPCARAAMKVYRSRAHLTCLTVLSVISTRAQLALPSRLCSILLCMCRIVILALLTVCIIPLLRRFGFLRQGTTSQLPAYVKLHKYPLPSAGPCSCKIQYCIASEHDIHFKQEIGNESLLQRHKLTSCREARSMGEGRHIDSLLQPL